MTRAQEEGEDGDASTVSERCLRYHEPTECLSKKTPVRYCVDRYEWPNKKGELPLLLVSWMDAKKMCEDAGKRLCTVAEFDFACEGPDMWPYTYGFERDAKKCNIDRQYRKRQKKLSKYDRCMNKPACKAELERLDQRLRRLTAGVRVAVRGLRHTAHQRMCAPWQEVPRPQRPEGGWWARCAGAAGPRRFHKEEDYGTRRASAAARIASPRRWRAQPSGGASPDAGQ